MAKKKSSASTKTTAKVAKKAKAAQKVERKEKKKQGKSKEEAEESEEDLESILDKLQRDWEEAHKVTEEVADGPPSRRANATFVPCPSGNYLWSIGGEFFSEDNKAHFYNDVYRYSPEKDEWRRYISPTCPGPRSAHAAVASPAGGGKIWVFGGEFSSLHQTTFHHYRDLWCFDITTHQWERIDTGIIPTARSGHRMAMWKHYIVLFGGFYDPGITTRYLNDLWLFDTQEYRWKQIEQRGDEKWPSPRSGFSFLPTVEGILLHGGYCKEYVKGKRPIGVMLQDTWFLRHPAVADAPPKKKDKDALPLTMKWERRKKIGYAPGLRSGCTMALWANKGMGLLFGGVTDEDTSEEGLESVFWNDLYGYQIEGNGRWISLTLKRPKKPGGKRKKVVKPVQRNEREDGEYGEDEDLPMNAKSPEGKTEAALANAEDDDDPDDPNKTIPLTRYNAMLAVLRNTLYIYGGIYERGSREYTLDDFYALALDKMDRYISLKENNLVLPADGEDVSSSDSQDSSDDEDSSGDEEKDNDNEGEDEKRNPDLEETPIEDQERTEDEKNALRSQAKAFMGVAKDTTRSTEDMLSTPLPGETLAMFYARSREYWAGKAHSSSDNRGKLLRRDAFAMAQDKYEEYKPILREVEQILAEAGLDEEEMRRSAAMAATGDANTGQSRNRR
ncbi:galactose oxidase [Neolentinus lepideus HHB14362 ss-1]|uniref:Galactose oxidase n=1 Tax=Neolentinus lepideus HHB14362 ss-1 TaxID=1314782 RepID=A0A165NJI3_9AGAM|nr:galactose oxidase [Neolentinus lepideus HHB14362 ss-1]